MAKKLIIDFSKAPYKGIFAEVARELQITPQAVSNAVHKYRTPKVIDRVMAKVNQRKQSNEQFSRTIAG